MSRFMPDPRYKPPEPPETASGPPSSSAMIPSRPLLGAGRPTTTVERSSKITEITRVGNISTRWTGVLYASTQVDIKDGSRGDFGCRWWEEREQIERAD